MGTDSIRDINLRSVIIRVIRGPPFCRGISMDPRFSVSRIPFFWPNQRTNCSSFRDTWRAWWWGLVSSGRVQLQAAGAESGGHHLPPWQAPGAENQRFSCGVCEKAVCRAPQAKRIGARTRTRSALVKQEPLGRQSPRRKRSSDTLPPTTWQSLNTG